MKLTKPIACPDDAGCWMVSGLSSGETLYPVHFSNEADARAAYILARIVGRVSEKEGFSDAGEIFDRAAK